MLNIEIKILQIPSVSVEGVEIIFPLRRAEALMYYMVCNKSATRKELVNLLWETCDNETGLKNLRNAMYVLKKAFGVDVLLTPRKTTVVLNPNLSINCDYARFMEQEDFSAYRGLFLSGFHIKGAEFFDEWVERTRDKVREQYLEYLSRLVRSATQKGAIARAERYAIDYLREEPSDEKMCLFLMELYRSGSLYQKASDVYRKLSSYLEEELAITPLTETTQAYYDILNEWNATTDEEREPLCTLFPSRIKLHNFLQRALHRYENDGMKGKHIHLAGEAGTGKTFLLEEALNRTAFKNVLLIRGACFQTSADRPYYTWQSILMDVVQHAREREILLPEKVIGRLSGVFPTLTGYANAKRPIAGYNAEDDFLHILHLVLRQRRIVLIIEDIQWMDVTGVGLLDAVLRRFHMGPLMLITLGRERVPEHVEKYLRQADNDRLLRLETVPCLDYDDVYLMIQEKYGSEVARLTAGRIVEETSGNLSLISSSLHPCPDGNISAALLERSRALLEKRVELLSLQARILLRMLSFFPDGAQYRVLEALCGIELIELSAACDELRRRGFAVEINREEHGVLAFLYNNAQERIYFSHSMLERQTIHEKIARLLRQQSEAPTGELYAQMEYHLAKSGNIPASLICKTDRLSAFVSLCFRRLPWFEGEQADAGCSLSGQQLELESVLTAIEHMTPLLDDMRQCRHQLLTLDAAMTLLAGYSIDALKKAIRHISLDDEATPFILVHYFIRYFRYNIYTKTLRPFTEFCRDSVKNSSDRPAHVFLLWLEGWMLELDGEHAAAEACLQSVLRENSHAGLTKAGILHAIGTIYLHQKDYARARFFFEQAVADLDDITPCMGLYSLYLDCGLAAMLLGDCEAAWHMAHTAAVKAIKALDDTGIVASYAHLAVFCAEKNEAETLRYLSKATELAEQAGSHYEQGIVCYAMAVLRARGRLAEHLDQHFSVYCRKGLMLLSSVKDTVELEALRKLLAP